LTNGKKDISARYGSTVDYLHIEAGMYKRIIHPFFFKKVEKQKRQVSPVGDAVPIPEVEAQELEIHHHRGQIAGCLLRGYVLQLVLFGLLALFVHVHPILPLDVDISRSFQRNRTPWLHITMLAISYPGSSPLLPALIILTTLFCWLAGSRLEAATVGGLSTVSLLLNLLLKFQVGRPRPTANVVHILRPERGYSFPSGHVMAYIAYWGLLFAFGVILFRGKHWWRTVLVATSATFVVLIGPSRVYLGDHWASDVLGAYLIGEALLGLALVIYLPLKERGVLETLEARARMEDNETMHWQTHFFTGAQ
jgi:membrane-associated phospholipid phosphatase